MRRILLLTMMAILALTASAYDFTVDGIAYNYLNGSNGNEVGVAYGSGSNINIPSQVTYNGKTYTVTRICNQAFCERNITSITIPSSITSIGNMAFSDCGVGAVYITDIAKWCEITFEGFRLSEAMGDIEEISNPLYQAHHLYLNGVEVKDLVIPNTVTRITSYAFLGCNSFTSVTIPSSVTSIGYGAFGLCDNIQSVHISDLAKWCEINFVDPYFDDWYGHGFSVLYSNPLRVAHHLYMNGEEIKNLIIPNTVTKINDYAFEGASSITSVTIPNSVKYLGDKSLSCSGLTEINSKIQDVSTVDTWDESYGRTKDVFESVPKTTCVLKVPAGTANSYRQTAPWSDFTNIVEVADELDDEFIVNGIAYKKNDNGNTVSVISNIVNNVNYPNLTVANIPASITVNGTTYAVTSIGNKAFYQCSGLTSVTIPNSVTSIGNYAFYSCSGMTSVTIVNSVTSISEGAFYSCSGLTSVTIGNSVTSIGNGAFRGCSGLTSVAIPNSVTSIGGGAFYGCSGLTSITIPNSVTSIGKSAFYGCKTLTSVIIPNSVTSVCDRTFTNCYGLTSVTIPNSVTSIGESAFHNCNRLTSVTIPNSVTSIGDYAFNSCSGMTSVIIGNSVTSIGKSVFSKCTALTSITIPNSVTSIGNDAFSHCSGLTSLTIPNSVTSISNTAFFGCSGLESIKVESGNSNYDSRNNCNAIIETVTNILITGCNNTVIPNSVTSIRGAFYGCSGLTSVTIPNSVISIGGSAFENCSGLTSVTIPNSVTSIGSQAFNGCSGLTEIRSKITDVSNVTLGSNVFGAWPPSSCKLKVPVGTSAAYRSANQWNAFSNINDVILMPSGTVGDLNRDNVVDGTDLNIMTNQLIHTTDYIDDDGITDINNDGRTSGFDINNMISIILGQ